MCQRIIDSGIDSWLGISVERIRESQPRIMGVDWSYDIHGSDAGREGSGSNKKKRAEKEQSEDVLPDYSETFAEDIVPAAAREEEEEVLETKREKSAEEATRVIAEDSILRAGGDIGDDHGSASLNGSRPRLPTDNLISEDPPTKRAKRPSVFLAPFCSYYFFYIIEICFDQNKLRQNFLPDFGDFM
ncbi:hypothetical protein DY000_02024242 [Brassica cretica]|uniref:Uncharacterized protein n=1 Tax=Brassica cretica TaxID=69181 RepID=A0ABQ7EDB5_BRACR|nr:hypothetical protein DY000_02024242 [Brassica cretica]